MEKIILFKKDLAQWLVDNNNDCGRDTYFSPDLRCAMTLEDSFSKLMKDYSKNELRELVFDYSIDGQKWLENSNLK